MFRILWGTGMVLVAVALLAFNAALIWVATGPRDLAEWLPRLEDTFNRQSTAWQVKVESGVLMWNGWQHPLDIRLRGVDVLTEQGQRFATFPDVSVGLSTLHLLVGDVKLASLTVRKPIISLFQDESGHISFGFPVEEVAQHPLEEAQGTALITAVRAFIRGYGDTPIATLSALNIEDAIVSVGNTTQGVVLKADRVHLNLSRDWHGLTASTAARIYQGEEPPAQLSAEFKPGASDTLSGHARVDYLWPRTIAPLVPQLPQLTGAQLPLSASVEVNVSEEGALSKAEFVLAGGAGKIEGDFLEEAIDLRALRAEGRWENGNTLAVEKLGVEFPGYTLNGSVAAHFAPEGVGLDVTAALRGAPVSHIRRFWLPGLAPMSRAWVVKNVLDGRVLEAALNLHTKPGDFAQPVLPKGAVDARIAVENGQLTYLAGHPAVRGVAGVVHVNETSLEADIVRAGAFTDTRLANGKLRIPDLIVDNPDIFLSLDADAPAADMGALLALPPMEVSQRLNINSKALAGRVRGHADLSFPYEAPRGPDGKPAADLGVKYDVKATLAGVAQPGFMQRFDVTGLNGELAANGAGVSFSGTGTANGVPSTLKVKYLSTPEAGMDTFITVDARAPAAALPKFGYPAFPWLSGTIGVEASVEQGGAKERTTATLNLKDAGIDWKEGHFAKPAGTPATLSLKTNKDEAGVAVEAFHFQSAGAEAKGSALLNADLSGAERLTLDTLKLGKNDLTLHYEAPKGGAVHLEARGAAADVSPWMGGKSHDFSFEHFPAIQATLDLGTLTLGENRTITLLRGHLRCGAVRCESADMAGNTGEGAFRFRITPAGQSRTLSVLAEDAGAMLRALDIYDTMKGGALSIDGTFDDTKPGNPLTASLLIRNYAIEDAPVLARLLSLASFGGLADTLAGNGISFKKLRAPFTLHRDVITLKDAKMFGDSIGLNAEGTLTFPGPKLNIEGTVVPAYALNTLLGQVPIIGDVVTGGGEGVFAARYSMTGAQEDPDVSVNPLSILTPGFLRGMFDALEGDSAPAAPATTPPKKR